LFNATLDFSDLSAGRFALDEMEFDLAETIAATVSACHAKAEAKGLKLICTLRRDLPPTVIGDPLRLRQLLGYLIDNAVKFTHRGEVEVRAAARSAGENCSLNVRVRDTGIGIPPDKLGLIFESFQQLDSGLGRSYTGLGLGLALARKLVHLMGGEISVESRPGKGSTFSFTIPLCLPFETTTAGNACPCEEPSRCVRILLVDDNSVAQRVVTHVLRKRGYLVKCASSGAEAVQAVSADFYDLILMDLQMPGMDGLETTSALRRLPGGARVPILALTANTTEEYRHLCLRYGMQGFLSKPVRSEELLDAVSRFLN
jgi:CheY-like chemotaxis protein/anti-sigma regulatory factor (Ser/Thr protein kinase)